MLRIENFFFSILRLFRNSPIRATKTLFKPFMLKTQQQKREKRKIQQTQKLQFLSFFVRDHSQCIKMKIYIFHSTATELLP
jgi:hypothetical protein